MSLLGGSIDQLTGWDAFWGFWCPSYERIRIARTFARKFGVGSVFIWKGQAWKVTSTDGRYEATERPKL